jgi:Tol biopolymer transport system component
MAGATIAVNLTSRAPAAPAPGATATAVPHLAFFSEFHPVLMQEGADGPSTLFNAYTEQPAGRGTALAFIGHQPVRGDSEHDGEVYYQAKPGDTPRALTDDDAVQAHPAISPNGAQVAFASKRSGNWDIWVVGTDGTGLRQLTDSPADDTWPTWSPDGGRIAFSSTRDDPAGDIYVMPARGGAATRITTDPAADIEPAWAPGGSQIAFTTTRARAAGDIALVGDNGGAVTLVTQATMSATQAAWHPDGKQLAFVSRDADPAGDIYAIDVTVAPVVPRPVAVTPGVPEHTPTWRDATGVRVTYTAGVDGTRFEGHTAADIWSAGLDGSAQADLTNRPNLIEQAPAYSPDGRRLAYREQRATGQPGITVADADGRNPKVLTTSTAAAGDDHPSWSPDGNLIAFDRSVGALSDRRAEIVIVRAADGVQVATVPCVVPGADTCEDAEPAWSPDGRQLAFTRYSFTRPVVIGAPRLGQPGNGQPAPGQPRTDGAGSGFAGVSLRTGPVPAVAPPPAAGPAGPRPRPRARRAPAGSAAGRARGGADRAGRARAVPARLDGGRATADRHHPHLRRAGRHQRPGRVRAMHRRLLRPGPGLPARRQATGVRPRRGRPADGQPGRHSRAGAVPVEPRGRHQPAGPGRPGVRAGRRDDRLRRLGAGGGVHPVGHLVGLRPVRAARRRRRPPPDRGAAR